MQRGGGSHSRYGRTPSPAPETSSPPSSDAPHRHGVVMEDASPISSRPPVPDDMEQLMPEIDEFVAAAAEDTDRGGGGGGGGNRWPRQETVALLKIRSDMDATFRDASHKGPLWEDVSRKMGEVGFKRSAKKCKEKFENVHKYYKRTKEGRVGRQDGKTYKFFSEIEALQTSTLPSSFPPLLLQPPMTLTPSPPPTTAAVNLQASSPVPTGIQLANLGVPVPSMVAIRPTVSPIFPASVPPASSPLGLIFSSNSSSSSPGSDNSEDVVERQPPTAGNNRKRGRAMETSSGSNALRMMEGLMKRVMQRQEEMHKRFLEAVEKREHDRLAREEAWRRQEIARLTREQELMDKERVVSASRDAVIMSFLQKITGHMIQLPSMATVTAVPVVSPRPLPPSQVPAAVPPPSSRRQQHQQPQRQPLPPPMYQPPLQEIIAPTPPPSGGGVGARGEMTSPSRWPKEEVLALISLRSGMELKYQEVGPKGPLWEEISAGMQRLGYKRNPRRCKEKWENINKYFKKVKESNKKRPEEAKTCPYFHELDALYRKKVLGNHGSGIEIRLGTNVPENVAGDVAQRGVVIFVDNLERMKNRGPEGEETESTNKPDDTVKEMNLARVADFGDKSDGLHDEQENENEDDREEDEDEEMGEDRKMAYKIEYQHRRQNPRPPNGSESGSTPSFAAMVQ